MNILDRAIMFSPLNEGSGTRRDLIGQHTLADNNTVLAGSGQTYGIWADFERDNKEWLSIDADSDLHLGSDNGGFALWYQPESFDITAQAIVTRCNTAASIFEYQLYILATTNVPSFYVENGGSSVDLNASFGALTAGQRYFICCWQDVTNGVVGIQVNNTYNTTAYTSGSAVTTHSFRIGGDDTGTNNHCFDGKASSFIFWKGRVPTLYERLWLYNGGKQRQFWEMQALRPKKFRYDKANAVTAFPEFYYRMMRS